MTSIGRTAPILWMTALALLGAPPAVQGQQDAAEDEARILFIRSWRCDPASVEEAFEILDRTPRSIAETLIGEDRLTGWGVARQSGREWNLYVDFQATDRQTAVRAQRLWSRRLADEDADGALRDRFSALCPDHRDTLFSIGDCPPPPEEEDQDG